MLSRWEKFQRFSILNAGLAYESASLLDVPRVVTAQKTSAPIYPRISPATLVTTRKHLLTNK
jgi:hypothetical protein